VEMPTEQWLKNVDTEVRVRIILECPRIQVADNTTLGLSWPFTSQEAGYDSKTGDRGRSSV